MESGSDFASLRRRKSKMMVTSRAVVRLRQAPATKVGNDIGSPIVSSPFGPEVGESKACIDQDFPPCLAIAASQWQSNVWATQKRPGSHELELRKRILRQ